MNLYTSGGFIIWGNIDLRCMKFEKRLQGRNDIEIQKSLKDPNKAVILQVSSGSHWILAVRKTLFGNDYVCIDPWTGARCTALGTYRNITGSAHFVRR